MAYRWNGTIATQTVAFRGTSAVSISGTNSNFPVDRLIRNAAYALNVTGGVSGSFGVHVIGVIGGNSFVIAGLTAVAAIGNYILYPTGFSSTGALQGIGTGLPLSDANRLDKTIAPRLVIFQSGVATAGISANCTVSAAVEGA